MESKYQGSDLVEAEVGGFRFRAEEREESALEVGVVALVFDGKGCLPLAFGLG